MNSLFRKVSLLMTTALAIFSSFVASATIFAADAVVICNPLDPNCDQTGATPSTGPTIPDIINKLIDFIFQIALIVCPLMIVIGGFYILSSNGDAKKVTQGRQIITFTLIGLVIILISKALTVMITKDILGITS